MDYKDLSITWSGDITSTSGWGYYSRALLKVLIEKGVSVKLQMLKPTRPEQKLSKWWEDNFKTLSENKEGIVRINHGGINNLSKNTIGGPTALIGHWESQHIPQNWANILKENYDEVWVPSKHLITERSTKLIQKPIRHIDYGIDYELLNSISNTMKLNNIDNNVFLFGSIGQWNQRRNMSDVLVAYFSQFTDKDNVALVLKTFGNQYGNIQEKHKIKEIIKQLKISLGRKNLPRVILLQDSMSYEGFISLMKRINCYVTASRGESKNISMKIAAALGKQCVYTNCLANKDFTDLNSSLMFPVDFVLEPCMNMNNIYSMNDHWARPNVSKMGTLMKKAFLDYYNNDLSSHRKHLKALVETRFKPEVGAAQLLNACNEILINMSVTIV